MLSTGKLAATDRADWEALFRDYPREQRGQGADRGRDRSGHTGFVVYQIPL